jgi:hypothetical protein
MVVTLTPLELGLIILALLLFAGLIFALVQNRRRANIRSKFGPEYERTVEETGSRRQAESLLQEREERVARFTIRPLTHDQTIYFTESWRKVQGQFVDDPNGAVTRADVLLGEIMEARGYPVADFEQRAKDLSVHHSGVVQNYRDAHAAMLHHGRGEASTEDLRNAMIQYRALFDEMVSDRDDADATAAPARPAPSEHVRE